MNDLIIKVQGYTYEPDKWQYVADQMTELGGAVFRHSMGNEAQIFYDTATAVKRLMDVIETHNKAAGAVETG